MLKHIRITRLNLVVYGLFNRLIKASHPSPTINHNKIAKLQMEIASYSFDIIVLTETHVDNSITDAKIFGSEYCIYRKDRQHGGHFGSGVLIATKRWIKASLREDLACESKYCSSICHPVKWKNT